MAMDVFVYLLSKLPPLYVHLNPQSYLIFLQSTQLYSVYGK